MKWVSMNNNPEIKVRQKLQKPGWKINKSEILLLKIRGGGRFERNKMVLMMRFFCGSIFGIIGSFFLRIPGFSLWFVLFNNEFTYQRFLLFPLCSDYWFCLYVLSVQQESDRHNLKKIRTMIIFFPLLK